jgi:hypothetical protein
MSDSCQDKLSHLERRLALLETYSIEAFWMALDRAYEATLSRRELKCTVCGTTGLRTDFIVLTEHCIFGGGMLERYQCQVCDAVFGPQKYLDLPEEFVSQDYALLYTHYAEINDSWDTGCWDTPPVEPRRGSYVARAPPPRVHLGREPINLEWSADVRFGAHNGLKSDIAPCPKSAMNG